MFDRSVLVYKVLNELCPESLRNMFQFRSSLLSYNTRNAKDLHVPPRKDFNMLALGPGVIFQMIQENCNR